jgi:hypothetical protein
MQFKTLSLRPSSSVEAALAKTLILVQVEYSELACALREVKRNVATINGAVAAAAL